MKKYLSMVPALLLIVVARFIPFNWIIGSQGASFSWTTMASPVVAKHCGLSWICLFFISTKVWTAISLLMFLLHRTPLIFASFAYKSRHWVTSFFVPASCMMLFICHDNGGDAWVYSLFWLIPMILYFTHNTIVSRALTASFVAHGVGSVVWLYSMDIPSALWISLIPVVIIERILMAAGMVFCDMLIIKVRSLCCRMIVSQKTGVA